MNPVLFDYLSQQTDLGSMPKPTDISMSDPKFQIASENGTAYITVEAMLNGEAGRIEKDSHYYETAKRLIELMHRIQDHVNLKKEQKAQPPSTN